MKVNTKEYMLEIGKNDPDRDYTAFLYRHYLEYEDAKGAYKTYIGRDIRKRLLTLFKRDGSVDRCLEIDLESGVVYYDIESETSGAVAYFYDTANRSVDNFEIRKLIYHTKGSPFEPDPALKKALVQLPCDNWAEVLCEIPGWEEAINNQYKELFLPHEPAQQLTLSSADLLSPDSTLCLPDGRSYAWSALTNIGLNFKARISRKIRHTDLKVVDHDGRPSLRYQNDQIGAEFFHEDEIYERHLNDLEYGWTLRQVLTMLDFTDNTGKEIASEEAAALARTGAEAQSSIVLTFGDTNLQFMMTSPEEVSKIQEIIMKFLRREIELNK